METNRRKFLRTAGLGAFAISTFGFTSYQAEEDRYAGDCATTDDILGPFYRPKAPVRSDLTYKSLKGLPLIIEGRVFEADCTTPLVGAQVEVWLADHDGDYDNKSDDFQGRGRQYADKKGYYQFKTIVPGRYLNGRKFRPAHIHFRVTGLEHKQLVSQVYFKGDPYIEEDPWASDSKAALRILPYEQAPGGIQKVTFDIYLESA